MRPGAKIQPARNFTVPDGLFRGSRGKGCPEGDEGRRNAAAHVREKLTREASYAIFR